MKVVNLNVVYCTSANADAVVVKFANMVVNGGAFFASLSSTAYVVVTTTSATGAFEAVNLVADAFMVASLAVVIASSTTVANTATCSAVNIGIAMADGGFDALIVYFDNS